VWLVLATSFQNSYIKRSNRQTFYPDATWSAKQGTCAGDDIMNLVGAATSMTESRSSDVERSSCLSQIEKTPASATISGVYVVGLHRALRKAGVPFAKPDEVRGLHYYPLREFMQTLIESAALLSPNLALRDGLTRLGLMVIPNFAESFGGKVLMSLGECSWEMALSCVTRGYQLSLRPGRARVVDIRKGHAEVELRDVWNFGDSYQVGVLQGLMNWYRINGTVTPEVISPSHTMLHMDWITH
jgi:uncharacterized protein (TIGR02265 family)